MEVKISLLFRQYYVDLSLDHAWPLLEGVLVLPQLLVEIKIEVAADQALIHKCSVSLPVHYLIQQLLQNL